MFRYSRRLSGCAFGMGLAVCFSCGIVLGVCGTDGPLVHPLPSMRAGTIDTCCFGSRTCSTLQSALGTMDPASRQLTQVGLDRHGSKHTTRTELHDRSAASLTRASPYSATDLRWRGGPRSAAMVSGPIGATVAAAIFSRRTLDLAPQRGDHCRTRGSGSSDECRCLAQSP
jgi:hypothetical protein